MHKQDSSKIEEKIFSCLNISTKSVSVDIVKFFKIVEEINDFKNKALKENSDRYEYVRRLNPREFAEIYKSNIETGVHFDQLISEKMNRDK